MNKLTLIYFEGCPNAKVALEALAPYSFIKVRQDDLSEEHPFKGYSSPTILMNGVPIIGTKLSGKDGGCSLENLSLEEIKQKLAKFSDKIGAIKEI